MRVPKCFLIGDPGRSAGEIRFQVSQVTGLQAFQGTVMRQEVIKYPGALSAGLSTGVRGMESFKGSKEELCKNIQLPLWTESKGIC